MIFRRLAFLFAMFSGLLTTQMPEYWQQYRQRLEGAIDELSAIVMQFERDSAAQGMTMHKGIVHLEENSDPLARSRGVAMQHTVSRLARLQRADAAFSAKSLPEKWWSLAANFDSAVATHAYHTYQPAVPTTSEGLIAGIIGFFVGGALIHLLALPIRYRHKIFRRSAAGPADATMI
ncbi:MAG: DUF2937 family protein [Beijerinckiaceae bacterium]|nr:MAG: DUF2937 family protein [Beijerinckiaceae bacterium]